MLIFNDPVNPIRIDDVDIDTNWFLIRLILVKLAKNTLLVSENWIHNHLNKQSTKKWLHMPANLMKLNIHVFVN